MAELVDMSFYRGEDISIVVTMVPTTDITGWTFEFTMRKTANLPIEIQMRSDDPSPQITILNAAAGIFRVIIFSAQTAGLVAGAHIYDIQRVDNASRAVLDIGSITLKAMVNPVDA